jgi:hypothetical protein
MNGALRRRLDERQPEIAGALFQSCDDAAGNIVGVDIDRHESALASSAHH